MIDTTRPWGIALRSAIMAEFLVRQEEVVHVTLYRHEAGGRDMCRTYRPKFGTTFLKDVTPGSGGNSRRVE